MDRQALTARQGEILKHLIDYHQMNERYPTSQEIADDFGFKSTNGAYEHLRAIERKGWIIIERGISRGIRVL